MFIFMHQYFRIIIFILTCFSSMCFLSAPVFSDTQKGSLNEPQFFSSLHDIPLMQGMKELEERAIFFDKPGGRISEAFALMYNINQHDVLQFYQQTLPQLGWGQVSVSSFFRKNEMLELSFEVNDGLQVVKVMIGPTL